MKKDLINVGNGAKELLQHNDTASASLPTFIISCLPTPRAIPPIERKRIFRPMPRHEVAYFGRGWIRFSAEALAVSNGAMKRAIIKN